jgi:hypothetical protein
VRVRVVGVWAPGQAEPWWLATDVADPLPDLALAKRIWQRRNTKALDDRRPSWSACCSVSVKGRT